MIHVVMGPPCSGKSTFVEQNAAPGTPRWDFDKVASTIAGADTAHEIPQPVLDTTMAARRGLLGWVLDPESQPPDIWIIHARPSDSLIARFAGVQAEFHLLDPGINECLARAIREGRPAHTEDTIRAWYENPPEIPQKGGGSMQKKRIDVQFKAGEDAGLGEGTMTAYASVFGNIDRYGDVVMPGAFTESLKEWADSGRPIPLLYGHQFSDPFSNIGKVTEAVEDEHGLKIVAEFDLDNPKAAQVYKLVKEKRIYQMSFAYDVLDAKEAERDGEYVFELHRLKLHEVSVVPLGANEESEILDVKGLDESQAQALRKAVDAFSEAMTKVFAHFSEGIKDTRVLEALLVGQEKQSNDPEPSTIDPTPTKGELDMLTAHLDLLGKENTND